MVDGVPCHHSFYMVTKTSQKNSLLIIFKIFTLHSNRSEKVDVLLSDCKRRSLAARERILVNNNALLPIVHVNPQYRIALSEHQLPKEEAALCKKAMCMKKFYEWLIYIFIFHISHSRFWVLMRKTLIINLKEKAKYLEPTSERTLHHPI